MMGTVYDDLARQDAFFRKHMDDPPALGDCVACDDREMAPDLGGLCQACSDDNARDASRAHAEKIDRLMMLDQGRQG